MDQVHEVMEDELAIQERELKAKREAKEAQDRTDRAREAFLAKWPSSSKITSTIDIINKELDSDEHTKLLVFSQWTSMLDLLEKPFSDAGIVFLRYDGSLSVPEREQVLAQFREEPECRVLMCSLKCASLGLNLTNASHVIIVDPWYFTTSY